MASFDADYELALKLQAEFNNEDSSRWKMKRKENVTALVPRPVKNSLVDSIWEITDPTPDIHALFLAFNKRFFWGTLDSVEVSWSSRMKSSAGVCSYQNRSGYCSVRLSAPLLKLRPRSDLVETLLHELIHAYLFVTNNDRDRDGHGPVFQSHMRRINKEAGTNITIYHNFHNEVKLYQQHWWRCDGPCQNKRPYFGFVKRSMNRAPGPNDIWWTEHHAMCGGHFIKIKEPDGFIKNKKKLSTQNTKTSNKKITGFFSPTSFKNVTQLKNITDRQSPVQPTTSKNVYGFADFTNENVKPPTGAIKKTTFPVPKTKHSPNNHENIRTPGSRGGSMLANKGGGTLVVTGKDQRNLKDVNKEQKTSIVPFSGKGYVLGTPTGKPNANANALPIPRKRNLGNSNLSELNIGKQKQPKLDTKVLSTDNHSTSNVKVSKTETNSHFNNCVDLTELIDDLPKDEICKCPVCDTNTSRSDMNTHLENCMGLSDIFNDSTVLEVSDDETVETNKVLCPCCDKKIEDEINKHLDECLSMLLLAEID